MPPQHINTKWTKFFGGITGRLATPQRWITRDDFLTNEGPPIATPRTCEPGPGILKAGNPENLYITDGEAFNVAATKASLRAPQAHVPGNATVIFFRLVTSNQQGFVIRTADNQPSYYGDGRLGWRLDYSSAMTERNDPNSANYGPITLNLASAGDGAACIVDNDGRLRVYEREKSTGVWNFLWITQYPCGLSTYWPGALSWITTGGAQIAISKWRGGVMPGVNQETLKVASPMSGVDYEAVADFVLFLTVTAPNPLAGYCELRYRVLDSENYCRIRLHDTGALTFDTVANGIVMNRQTGANAVAAGETVRLALSTRTNQHRAASYAVPHANKVAFDPATQSHYDTQTVLCPVVSGDWTLGELIVYPRYHESYQLLSVDGGGSSGGSAPDGLMMSATLGGVGVYG